MLVAIFGRKVSVWDEKQGKKSLFENNSLLRKPSSTKHPFCLASSLNVMGTTMGQCVRDGCVSQALLRCICTPRCTPVLQLSQEHHSAKTLLRNPLACLPELFYSNPLLPLASRLSYINKPHWAKTTPGVTSDVHCLSAPSLGSVGAPALPSPTRKWSPAGKIPKTSLRRNLAELGAKVKEALG